MNWFSRMRSAAARFFRAAAIDPLVAALNSRYPQIAGLSVTPETAARKVAVGSSVRLLTNAARSMPAHAYRGEGTTTQRVSPDPVLLRDPAANRKGYGDWVAQLLWSLLTRGNAFGHIVGRDSRYGTPTVIVPVHPDLIVPMVDRDGVLTWQLPGQRVEASDIWHLRMYPVPGAVLGLSPIEQHAATIGVGIAAEKFGADFFNGGGHPTGMLKSAAPLNETQAQSVKTKFLTATSNREPVLLPEGIDYQQIQIKPNESQFLDTMNYSAAECARIFGPGVAEVLGYETGAAMTYQNVVDRDLHLLKYALDPYLVLIEDALSDLLAQPQYVKINRDSLLRTNTIDRYRAYEIGIRNGFLVPDDARGKEDLPPVPWGQEAYVPAKKTETVAEPAGAN